MNWHKKDVSLILPVKIETAWKMGYGVTGPTIWLWGNPAGNDCFPVLLLYPNFREMTQKTVVGHFVTSSSFCQLSDDLVKVLGKPWHKVGWLYAEFLFNLWPILSLSVQKYIWTCWKAKQLCVVQVLINILETGQWTFGAGPFPLFWVTHHKTNYGVGKL